MKYLQLLLMILYVLATGYACQSLLEQDISKDTVALYSPPDGHASTNFLQTLWWEEVEGATSYHLQVVSPSFDYMRRLVLDTNVTTTQFTYTFQPDTFAWRVTAKNPAYETPFSEAVFYIDSTDKPQTVNLISPSNNLATNAQSLTFKWGTAQNATRYRILILNGEDVFNEKQIEEGTEITYPDEENGLPQLTDGDYYWQVRSENTLANSEYSAPWKLIVDLTPPQTPVIISPVMNDTIDTYRLSWQHPSNAGTAITDSLIIYKDSTGTTLYHEQFIADTSFTRETAAEGWYQFKVKSFDAAANESGWTSIRRFYFKESTDD